MWPIFLIILGLVGGGDLYALDLSPQKGAVQVVQVERLSDPLGQWEVQDLDLLDFNHPPESTAPGKGTPTLWLRLEVHNPLANPQTWFLRFEDPVDRPVRMFLLGSLGIFSSQTSLGNIPFGPEGFQPFHSHPVFGLSLAGYQNRQIILKLVLEPRYLQDNPRISLLTPKAYAEAQGEQRLAQGAYLGLVLALVLLSLFGWLHRRHRGYLYFGLSLLFLAGAQVFLTGQGLEFLWHPRFRLYPQIWGQALACLGLLALTLFYRRGLGLGAGLRRSLDGLLAVQLLALALGPLYGFWINPDLPWLGLLALLSLSGWALALSERPNLRWQLPAAALLVASLFSPWFNALAWMAPVAQFLALALFVWQRSQASDQTYFDKIAKFSGEIRLRDEYVLSLEAKINERTQSLLVAKANAEESNRERAELLEILVRRLAGQLTPEQPQLETMVQDLLDYARLSQALPAAEAVEPVAELRALAGICLPQALAAQITFTIECPDDLPARLMLCRPVFWQIGLRLFEVGMRLDAGGALRMALSQPLAGELRLSVWIAGLEGTEDEMVQYVSPLAQSGSMSLAVVKGWTEALGGEMRFEAAHGGQWVHALLPVAPATGDWRERPFEGQRAQVVAASSLKNRAIRLALAALGVESLPPVEPQDFEGADWLVLGELASWAGAEAWREAAQRTSTALVDLALDRNLAGLDLDSLAAALQDPPQRVETPLVAPIEGSLAERLPLRIAVAEDDPTSRVYLQKMLEYQGYQPQVVTNGKKLVELLRQVEVDVVLLDVRMPVMDGLEAARRIRARLGPDRTPLLVALTSNALEQDEALYLSIGLDGFLVKPLLPDSMERLALGWSRKIAAKRKTAGPLA
ncbi:MAG: response regulator [bacterium]|nr:response regulator [bacterium]